MEELNNKETKLDIGKVINEAFEIYKKIAIMGGFAFMLLCFVLVIFAFMAVGIFKNPEQLKETMEHFNPNELSFKGTLIYIGIMTLLTLLLSPFMAGMLKMAHDADNEEEVYFSAIFHYVNHPSFIHIVLATTLITFVSIAANMFIKFLMPGSLGGIVGFVFSCVFTILTYMTLPLIIFNNNNFITAIKISLSKITKHFFIVALLFVVAFILQLVGFFAFCVGIFFTVPFAYAMQYSIYKNLNE